jgi:hypothetical protein
MVVFAQMQLVEYFLWKNIKVPRLNALGSQAAALVVLLEPIAAIYMIENLDLRNKMLIAYSIYAALLLVTQSFDWRTTVGGNGHLKWEWLPHPIVMAPWFIFFLAPLWIAGHRIVLMAAVATLALSTYYYSKYGTISSMWCWIAVSGLLFLFITSLIQR